MSERKVTITERGWAGHFIASARCRFRRNTLVEGPGGRFVVSTVGAMIIETDGKQALETIGHERYYETMCWPAHREGPYWEANVSAEEIEIDDWAISAKAPVDILDGVDNDANDMHEKAVQRVAELAAKEANNE